MKRSFRRYKIPARHIIALMLIFVFSSLTNVMLSQDNKPTRQSSLEAFSNGDYEKAYNEFKELLVTYPKDPLYKYYSGVCLVKMSKDPAEAESLLRDALNGASVLKTLPADAFLYLGKSQQMQGKFDEAVSTYNHFSREAGRKRAKEEDVPALIQQCKNKEGKLANSVAAEKKEEETAVPKEEPALPVKREVPEKTGEPATVRTVQAAQELPSGYEKILDDAVVLQSKADSLNDLAARQRKEAAGLTGSEKSRLTAAAASNEAQAQDLQKSADQKYSQAQSSMNPVRDTSAKQSVQRKPAPAGKVGQDSLALPAVKQEIKPGTQTAKNVEIPAVQLDAKNVAVGEPSVPVEAYSDFEVIPGPSVFDDAAIKINPDVPDGLIYRIQVAVFRNPVKFSHFKGLKPIYGFRGSNGLTTYYAGMFRRSADAHDALSVVRGKGFRDAFVVAFSGSKRVSGSKASDLEKEWGNRPFINLVPKEQPVKTDTAAPTLSYRVEVARSVKPLSDNLTTSLIKISASRGLDVFKLDDGTFVYLIGNFITFESASEYSDLLKRNGYQDAKVTAWLGKKEIPVDTARKLFDSLK